MSLSYIVLLIIAGLGAGIVTGLAGASAATIVTPLLVTFSSISAYAAITVSLIADVFASFFSFMTYRKHGNVDMKHGITLTIFACLGAFIGSYIASTIPDATLGSSSGMVTLMLGLNFVYKSFKAKKKGVAKPKRRFEEHQGIASAILGSLIGLICGIVGAGGGIMILMILTSVLGYDTKVAIGTSVLIMTFTALTGGVSHFIHLSAIPWMEFAITSVFAVIGAKLAAKFANVASEEVLLRIVGITFTTLAIVMIIQKNVM